MENREREKTEGRKRKHRENRVSERWSELRKHADEL